MRRLLPCSRLLPALCLLSLADVAHGQQDVIATSASAAAAPSSNAIVPAAYFDSVPPTVSRDPRSSAATAPDDGAVNVVLQVVAPQRLTVGGVLVEEIIVHNRSARPIAELRVEQPLPADVQALRCDPSAVSHNQRLIWDLRNLPAGGQRRLKAELRPSGDGEIDLRPYVTFLPGDGPRTRVVYPPFTIELTANCTDVPRNGSIRFTIRVANHGNAPLLHVKLYDQLPPGLIHLKMGPKIFANLGDLQPGQSRTVTLDTHAVQIGKFSNEVRAQADGGVEAHAALAVTITEPKLLLNVVGPTHSVSQRDEEFRLELDNPGPLTAKNVRLLQALPPTFDVVSVNAGGYFDTNQHSLLWSLPNMPSGQRRAVTFHGRVSAAGDWPMTAAVTTDNLPETRIEHFLHVAAAALVHLEASARDEGLAVNDETVYRLHVFNKGDAPCSGVRLVATLPDMVTAIDAQGGQIVAQQVRFTQTGPLPGGSDAVYRIGVRARAPGKGSIRIELSADKQPSLQREMSVQVSPSPKR